jgi:hypothetical protein
MAKQPDSKQSDLPKLAAPARRALDAAGYTRLSQLSKVSEAEIAQLHGIGPNAIKLLRKALAEADLSFADESSQRGEPATSGRMAMPQRRKE